MSWQINAMRILISESQPGQLLAEPGTVEIEASGVSERRGRRLFGGIDPVKKHGPGTVADLRVVTPSGDSD